MAQLEAAGPHSLLEGKYMMYFAGTPREPCEQWIPPPAPQVILSWFRFGHGPRFESAIRPIRTKFLCPHNIVLTMFQHIPVIGYSNIVLRNSPDHKDQPYCPVVREHFKTYHQWTTKTPPVVHAATFKTCHQATVLTVQHAQISFAFRGRGACGGLTPSDFFRGASYPSTNMSGDV